MTVTAAPAPSSLLIKLPSFSARVRTPSSEITSRIALERFSAVNFFCGMGSLATPSSCSVLPQYVWSAINGHITDGRPALRAAARSTCTAMMYYGAHTRKEPPHEAPIRAQEPNREDQQPSDRPNPVTRMPRTPASSSACRTSLVFFSGSRPAILPKPTHTGGSPSSRNRTRSTEGHQLSSSSRNQYPLIWAERIPRTNAQPRKAQRGKVRCRDILRK